MKKPDSVCVRSCVPAFASGPGHDDSAPSRAAQSRLIAFEMAVWASIATFARFIRSPKPNESESCHSPLSSRQVRRNVTLYITPFSVSFCQMAARMLRLRTSCTGRLPDLPADARAAAAAEEDADLLMTAPAGGK